MKIFLLNSHTVTWDIVEELAQTLPPFRAARAARCRRPEGYMQTVMGFCLVRYALKQLDPRADTAAWEFAENGKPRLAAGKPFFNLAHTAHCIAVAVSDTEEIGVDVEEIKPRHTGFASKYCSDREQAAILAASDPTSELIRVWSRKEAEVKRTGVGIGQDLRHISSEHVKSLFLAVSDVPHWLSVAPASFFPPVIWVNAEQLLSDCQAEP